MSTWKELYDDLLQELSMYQEDIKLTPQQGMRYLTKAVTEFQRLTNIAESTKTITPNGNVSLPTTPYVLNSDILEMIEVMDVDGYTLLPVSYQQFNDIVERSKSGRIGFNENTAHISRTRERPTSSLEEWSLSEERGMMRMYTVWNEQLYRYPAFTTDATLTVRYKPHYDQYSSASTQWTSWWTSETAFETNFATLKPPSQLLKWAPSFVAYAAGQFLRSQNVMAGQQPLWQQYDQEFRQYVDQAIMHQPTLVHELSSPYNISPYSN